MLGCLGPRWEKELVLLALTVSKRNNNFSLGTRYSFPHNLELAGGFDRASRVLAVVGELTAG